MSAPVGSDDPAAAPKPGATRAALPFVTLGLLTLATMAGPFAIFLTIRGGARPEWPPDRPVEWWVFGVVTGAVVVLMTACVTVGLWSRAGRSERRKT